MNLMNGLALPITARNNIKPDAYIDKVALVQGRGIAGSFIPIGRVDVVWDTHSDADFGQDLPRIVQ
jgi:hypothetical protein